MRTTLILGYGNLDRQDDGVAWHILENIAATLCREIPGELDGFEPSGQNPDLMFRLQLTPEMGEIVARYERVCFVDAHTGAVPNEIHIEKLAPNFQNSPFTHHMTARTCLAIADTLYGKRPQGILISVRGYHFGFDRHLSSATQVLAQQAAQRILEWCEADK